MTDSELAIRQFGELCRSDWGHGLFLLDAQGRFLAGSPRFLKFVGLTVKGLTDCSLSDFDCDLGGELGYSHRFTELQVRGDDGQVCTSQWLVSGQDLHVRTDLRILREPMTDRPIGCIGCVTDVGEAERYHRLFGHLPLGAYRLDRDDVIRDANDAFVSMLGCASTREVLGREVQAFYADPHEARALRDQVITSGSVRQHVIELVRPSGEYFYAEVTSVAIVGADGDYRGREGTVIDVTPREHYRRSLDDVPVGFYVVRIENDADIIRQCNGQFATMFGYGSPDEVIGLDIEMLYAQAGDHAKFLQQLEANDREGMSLLGEPLRVKRRQGSEFWIEVNCRLIRDRTNRVVGRTGVVRDISEEQLLRTEIVGLQGDIGRMLHAYTSTLMELRHKLTHISASFAPDPFAPLTRPESADLDAKLSAPARRLSEALNALLDSVEPDWMGRELTLTEHTQLTKLTNVLQSYPTSIPKAEHRPPFLRAQARLVIGLCDDLGKRKVQRDLVREARRMASEVERIVCLSVLHELEAVAVEMDHDAESLREFVTTGSRPVVSDKAVPLWDLLEQAITNLGEYANVRGVQVKSSDRSRRALVLVSERSVRFALWNLVHNAIKYSWHRELQRPPWVDVECYVDASQVFVHLRNFGVPIPQDEIDRGLVFALGFRGSMSTDRGRPGTGIGLHQALHTARQHGGGIRVESKPASPEHSHHDYTVPFLTDVWFWLPLHQKKGGRDGK